MRWILALHLIAMVAWFAGLFYLPRLFVYHAQADDPISIARFKVMEFRLYYAIMMPAALVAIISGGTLYYFNWHLYWTQNWMHAKLILVFLLIFYHIYCGYLVGLFKQDKNHFDSKFYRFFNEVPTLLLIAIMILVIVKPI